MAGDDDPRIVAAIMTVFNQDCRLLTGGALFVIALGMAGTTRQERDTALAKAQEMKSNAGQKRFCEALEPIMSEHGW
jgi:hypothetical protein